MRKIETLFVNNRLYLSNNLVTIASVIIKKVDRACSFQHCFYKSQVQINHREQMKLLRLEQMVAKIVKDVRVVLDVTIITQKSYKVMNLIFLKSNLTDDFEFKSPKKLQFWVKIWIFGTKIQLFDSFLRMKYSRLAWRKHSHMFCKN